MRKERINVEANLAQIMSFILAAKSRRRVAQEARQEVEVEEWALEFVRDFPTPFGWDKVKDHRLGPGLNAYIHKKWGLKVLLSARTHKDGKRWLQISASKRASMPNWDEMKAVKAHFITDLTALVVLPPKAQYVNVDATVLHLWHCLDGDVTPDFRNPEGGI